MTPEKTARKPVPEERAVRAADAPLRFDDETVPDELPPGKSLRAADATLTHVDESEIGAGGK